MLLLSIYEDSTLSFNDAMETLTVMIMLTIPCARGRAYHIYSMHFALVLPLLERNTCFVPV